MSASVALTCVLIVLARVTDVSLDTVRTASVVQGRRGFSAALGFFEALIYIVVVAQVLRNFDHPVYAIAYGGGYALGTYLGIVVEQHLAFGTQLAWFITSRGGAMSEALDGAGYPVARIEGHARRGDVSIFYVEVPRRRTQHLMRTARSADESCFCVVNDLRLASYVPVNPIPVRTV
jgi:uncharacterized protein YebE (UPF0316 family)